MRNQWKRNAVVATVLLFVCAAVYLNWRYAGDVAGDAAPASQTAEEPGGFFQSVRPQPAGGVCPDLVQVQSLDPVPLQADGSTFSRC